MKVQYPFKNKSASDLYENNENKNDSGFYPVMEDFDIDKIKDMNFMYSRDFVLLKHMWRIEDKSNIMKYFQSGITL